MVTGYLALRCVQSQSRTEHFLRTQYNRTIWCWLLRVIGYCIVDAGHNWTFVPKVLDRWTLKRKNSWGLRRAWEENLRGHKAVMFTASEYRRQDLSIEWFLILILDSLACYG